MITFASIPKFTESAHYQVNIAWDSLIDDIKRYVEKYNLIFNPDFQRGHIWTKEKLLEYVDILKFPEMYDYYKLLYL